MLARYRVDATELSITRTPPFAGACYGGAVDYKQFCLLSLAQRNGLGVVSAFEAAPHVLMAFGELLRGPIDGEDGVEHLCFRNVRVRPQVYLGDAIAAAMRVAAVDGVWVKLALAFKCVKELVVRDGVAHFIRGDDGLRVLLRPVYGHRGVERRDVC
jgi:hypothetical protein